MCSRGICEGACEVRHVHHHTCPVCESEFACGRTDCPDERPCRECRSDGFAKCDYCGDWAAPVVDGLCAGCRVDAIDAADMRADAWLQAAKEA